jgi:hypothetical protein
MGSRPPAAPGYSLFAIRCSFFANATRTKEIFVLCRRIVSTKHEIGAKYDERPSIHVSDTTATPSLCRLEGVSHFCFLAVKFLREAAMPPPRHRKPIMNSHFIKGVLNQISLIQGLPKGRMYRIIGSMARPKTCLEGGVGMFRRASRLLLEVCRPCHSRY